MRILTSHSDWHLPLCRIKCSVIIFWHHLLQSGQACTKDTISLIFVFKTQSLCAFIQRPWKFPSICDTMHSTETHACDAQCTRVGLRNNSSRASWITTAVHNALSKHLVDIMDSCPVETGCIMNLSRHQCEWPCTIHIMHPIASSEQSQHSEYLNTIMVSTSSTVYYTSYTIQTSSQNVTTTWLDDIKTLKQNEIILFIIMSPLTDF